MIAVCNKLMCLSGFGNDHITEEIVAIKTFSLIIRNDDVV